ncbi:hypothetical protein [Geobacter argillaceus]|uniref:Glycosyl transferase family 2 n=1 Tax=Geobacter argillaceus TaxID=345631 RepID=A0A562WU65_9BACT|nr:hypothetical protein [Geobacter argillaceus]TWJ33043.1 hypothetical protein JN12_00454 [Geobacter argillaceus]
MPTRLVVATSIVPRNIELQQSAIASWQALGFDVISINSSSEIKAVQQYFPSVSFVSADRTAEQLTGKPFVYFDDVCRALTESGADICGIINSDIFLRADGDFKEFISRESRGSFLFGSRIDVTSPEDSDGEIFFVGFDFFFFDRSILACYPPSEFCLGAPWWDYWAPMVPLIRGIPCKEIVSPLAYHVWHETKWAPDHFQQFGKILIREIQKISESFDLDPELATGLLEVSRSNEITIFSFVVLQYILDNASRVVFDCQGANGSRVTIGMHQFESMRRYMIDRRRECCAAAGEIETLKCSVEDLKGESEKNRDATITALQKRLERLDQLESSLSWRLTAPLRKILDALRR